MAEITGAATIAGYQINPAATAYGTAVALGAGDRLQARISPETSVTDLRQSPIGSGAGMDSDAVKGNISPGYGIEMELGYQNGADQILAQFFGAETNAGEQTVGQGDYLHRLTTNLSFNDNYGTFAFESTDSTTIELPSAAATTIGIAISDVANFLTFTASLLGNKLELASAVNTNAVLATTTIADTDVAVAQFEDEFLINLESGGALASPGDCQPVTDYTLSLTKPQSLVGEIRCASGNGEPIADDLFNGTLSVTIKQLENHTYFTGWDIEDTYKSQLNVEGTQIGTGLNKTFSVFLPKMKLIDPPDYSVSNTGINSVTLNFVLLAAAAVPTGMNSTLPYVEFVNTRSADYIT